MTAKELYEWAIKNDCEEAELKAIVKASIYDWETQQHDYISFDQCIELYHLDVRVDTDFGEVIEIELED